MRVALLLICSLVFAEQARASFVVKIVEKLFDVAGTALIMRVIDQIEKERAAGYPRTPMGPQPNTLGLSRFEGKTHACDKIKAPILSKTFSDDRFPNPRLNPTKAGEALAFLRQTQQKLDTLAAPRGAANEPLEMSMIVAFSLCNRELLRVYGNEIEAICNPHKDPYKELTPARSGELQALCTSRRS